MKHKTLPKFITAYLLFLLVGIICFFSLVPSALYQFLLKRQAERLVDTVKDISGYEEIYNCNFAEDSDTLHTRDILLALAINQDSHIWLVNNEGRILMNCRNDSPLAQSTVIPDFDSIATTHTSWIAGNFFDMFSEPVLSVMAPVKNIPHTTDYVIFHYPLYQIENKRDQLMTVCFLILCIGVLFSLIIPFIFYWIFYRPFQNVLQVSNDYACGNLNRISPPSGDDEFAMLKTNLNYMAEEIKQSEESQRSFISNISHDFRSPLTSIKGYAEAILDGTIPKESQDKYLEIILIETERLITLTKKILTANSLKDNKTSMEYSVFDINSVIESIVSSVEIQCRKKDLQILMNLPSYPQYVRADNEKIQQVIYNLLDNAIKFSYPHSDIRISTAEKNKYLFVSVKDKGEGISPDEIPKIWNRFYKADSSRGKDKKGTGLGLSIVREIIQAHGQNINVISTKDVGSEFIFTLDKAEG